jgi:hypothetical protein
MGRCTKLEAIENISIFSMPQLGESIEDSMIYSCSLN